MFANIKSLYWLKECSLTMKQLKGRFPHEKLIAELVEEKAIKVKDELVNITFLDIQRADILKMKKRLSAAGKKGYLAKVEKAGLKPPLSNVSEAPLKQPDKIREDNTNSTTDISKPELPATSGENGESKKQLSFEDKYKWFIGMLNEIGNRKFKGDPKSKRQFKARLVDFSSTEMKLAVKNLYRDPTHREQNFKYATPEFITRPDKMERYVAEKQ